MHPPPRGHVPSRCAAIPRLRRAWLCRRSPRRLTARHVQCRMLAWPHHRRLPGPQGRPHSSFGPGQLHSALELDLRKTNVGLPLGLQLHRPEPAVPAVPYQLTAPPPPSQPAPATTRILRMSTFETSSSTADLRERLRRQAFYQTMLRQLVPAIKPKLAAR